MDIENIIWVLIILIWFLIGSLAIGNTLHSLEQPLLINGRQGTTDMNKTPLW